MQVELALMAKVMIAGFVTVSHRSVLLIPPMLAVLVLMSKLVQYCLTLQHILSGWLELMAS